MKALQLQQRGGWAATALAVATTVGCGPVVPEENLPEVLAAETEHFLYYVRPGEDVCEATLEELESHFRTTQEILGFDWPEGRKVPYYRYRDDEDMQQNGPCGERCVQRWSDIRVALHAVYEVDRHELVHAYLAHVGFPHGVLLEGIAELFQCESAVPFRDPFVVEDWRDALFRRRADGKGWADYYPASVFVRRLVDRFGPEAFLAAYAEGERSETRESLEAQVEAGWGLTMDEAWADTIEHRRSGRYLPYCGCEGAVLPAEGERRLSQCEAALERAIVYDAPRDGFVAFETHKGSAANYLRICDESEKSWTLPVGGFPGRGLTIGPVTGGQRYFTTGVTVARATPLPDEVIGSRCEDAPTYAVTADTWLEEIAVNTTKAGPVRVWVELATEFTFSGATNGLRICATCDEQNEAGECPRAKDRFRTDDALPMRFLLEVPQSKYVEVLETKPWAHCPDPCTSAWGQDDPTCPPRCWEGEPSPPP